MTTSFCSPSAPTSFTSEPESFGDEEHSVWNLLLVVFVRWNTLSFKNGFNPMTLSSKIIFIQWHFRPKSFSSKISCVQNQFQPKIAEARRVAPRRVGARSVRHEYEYCDVCVNRSDDNMLDVCFQDSQLTSDPTTTPQQCNKGDRQRCQSS